MQKTMYVLLIEITPIVVFFAAGQFLTFAAATAWYLLATAVGMGIVWQLAGRVSYLSLIFGATIMIFGSMSIWLAKPDILILADTIYYCSAGLILASLQLRGYNVMERLFSPTFGMTAQGWRILTWRWVTMLLLAGILNELVRQLGTTDDWLWFQLIRTIVFILFATYQFTLTKRYRLPTATAWGIVVAK